MVKSIGVATGKVNVMKDNPLSAQVSDRTFVICGGLMATILFCIKQRKITLAPPSPQ